MPESRKTESHFAMPEGRETRSDSDYVSHLSGISRLERTVAASHEAPAQQTAGVTEWATAGVTEWGDRVGDGVSERTIQ